jgi:hypothetical protein
MPWSLGVRARSSSMDIQTRTMPAVWTLISLPWAMSLLWDAGQSPGAQNDSPLSPCPAVKWNMWPAVTEQRKPCGYVANLTFLATNRLCLLYTVTTRALSP